MQRRESKREKKIGVVIGKLKASRTGIGGGISEEKRERDIVARDDVVMSSNGDAIPFLLPIATLTQRNHLYRVCYFCSSIDNVA